MAVSGSCSKLISAHFFRFIDTVRHENTHQALEILRELSQVDQMNLTVWTYFLVPESKAELITEVVRLLQEEKGCLDLVLVYECNLAVCRTILSMCPLLEAIKYGDIVKVNRLIEELPKKEALLLITHSCYCRQSNESISDTMDREGMLDNLLARIGERLDKHYSLSREQKLMVRRNQLIQRTLQRQIVNGPSKGISELMGGLVYSAFCGSIDTFKYLLSHLEENAASFINDMADWRWLGICIASHRPQISNELMNLLVKNSLFRSKLKTDPSASIWIVLAVGVGLCGEEVESLILDTLTWDKQLENTMIGIIISKPNLMEVILRRVPEEKMVMFLIRKFDITDLVVDVEVWEEYFSTPEGSVLCLASSNNKIELLRKYLTPKHEKQLCELVQQSSDTITRGTLELSQPYLAKYCLSSKPTASLRMFGMVCFNDFDGYQGVVREGAAVEAQMMGESLENVGIDVSKVARNWSTYELLGALREFCRRISDRCSLLVICIMSHGNAGMIYGCGGLEEQTGSYHLNDSCQINDIISIIGKEMPQHVPKLVIVQACQGLRKCASMTLLHQYAGSADTTCLLDAQRAESRTDDFYNKHMELDIPNLTLLMSVRYGSQAYRNHFIPALASEIRRADGIRSVHDMFVAASRKMMCHRDQKYRLQNPEYRSTNRNKLVLPKRSDKDEAELAAKGQTMKPQRKEKKHRSKHYQRRQACTTQ